MPVLAVENTCDESDTDFPLNLLILFFLNLERTVFHSPTGRIKTLRAFLFYLKKKKKKKWTFRHVFILK